MMITKEVRYPAQSYQKQFYIDSHNGDDLSNDGTQTRPYKTISKALTACGSAATQADFHNDAINRRTFYVAPGQYTENLTLPMWKNLTFVLDNAQIVGNITHQFITATYQLAGGSQVKVTFMAMDLRSAFDNAGVAQVGIQGNFTFNPTGAPSPTIHVLEFINCGIVGNIVCAAVTQGYLAQILASDAYIIGDVIANSSPTGIAATLVYSNCDYQASRSAGGTSGNVALFCLRNVRFTRPVVTSSTTGGRWFNTTFNSGAHNFTGFGGTIETDSVSYASYLANVPTKGGGTFTLLDNANAVRYTPTTSAQWPTVPTTILGALDSLVAKDVRAINTTAVNNGTTVETNLIQFTLTAGVLATNGNIVTVSASGRFAANANNKRVRFYLGATVLYDTAALAFNGGSWWLRAEIIRTSATAQKVIVEFQTSGGALGQPATTYTLGAENLANALVIKCTGQGGASSDITQESMVTTIVRA